MICSIAWMFEPTFAWLSITPFGLPVEPEVKITVSKSSPRKRSTPNCAFQDRHRQQPGLHESDQLVEPRGLGCEIFEINQLGLHVELQPLHESAAGQHVPNAAIGDAMIQQRRGKRVVQIYADPAHQRHRGIGHDSAAPKAAATGRRISRREPESRGSESAAKRASGAAISPPVSSVPIESATFARPQLRRHIRRKRTRQDQRGIGHRAKILARRASGPCEGR